ncbi:hypothetical protein MKQ70_01385 [Chitinophaga sedimenti]|uniref:hypothetical protein n=1 Tax=Chitinophaga sedimenti TaxID=2033606 RepID=UPI002003387A|nr:hypothetical protein [Chitinophaga sedimenti]MCK7553724.1 hypothetical protein [Chitinophaga sedimenti]
MNKGILTEIYAGKPVDFYRRNLQKLYILRILQQAFTQDSKGIISMGTYNVSGSDMQGIMRDVLRQQQQLFKRQMQSPAIDKITRIHLREMYDRIEKTFESKVTL